MDQDTRLRVDNAEVLFEALRGARGVGLPAQVEGAEPAWTNFVVRVADRVKVKQRMLECGFDTTWGYLNAVDTIADAGDCPNARALERENLYLPLWTHQDGVRRMADCLKRAVLT